MPSINEITIMGHLGQTPDLSYTRNDTPVTNLSVATNKNYKSNGEWQSDTSWHDVVVWGDQAERIVDKLDKGDLVHVSGRLEYDEWTGDDGQTRTKAQINARRVLPIGRTDDNSQSTSGGGQERQTPPPPSEDEIPF